MNAVSFHSSGEWVVTSSDDESIHVYNAAEGTLSSTLYSKKYGVDRIKYTHHINSVLTASKNEWDHTLRYLSLHDNRYLRYFKGHRGAVTSLEISPVDDSFLSGSQDGSVRLWDVRAPECAGFLRLPPAATPAVAFDPEGIIFGVAVANPGRGSAHAVKLYDARSYDKGPFATFDLDLGNDNSLVFSSLAFSPDGGSILLSTTGEPLVVLDSMNGELRAILRGRLNEVNLPLQASYSPDGQYIVSGSENGAVHIWPAAPPTTSIAVDDFVALRGHPEPTLNVAWSPTSALIVSACSSVGFWVPPDPKE